VQVKGQPYKLEFRIWEILSCLLTDLKLYTYYSL
jgi:hypothetical protein